MVTSVLFVSVNQSFDPSYTLAQLEPWVERAWAISAPKASQCDRVVAVFEKRPIACWRVRAAFLTDEVFETSGGTRPRVGLSLGDPLPLLPEYDDVPALRRGVATAELDVEPLRGERDTAPPGD